MEPEVQVRPGAVVMGEEESLVLVLEALWDGGKVGEGVCAGEMDLLT